VREGETWVRELGERGVEATYVGRDSRGETEGVAVMTRHRAKGMEFSRVAMVGLGEGAKFPGADSDGEDLRQRSLVYVGATRARDRLAVSWVGEPHPVLADRAITNGTREVRGDSSEQGEMSGLTQNFTEKDLEQGIIRVPRITKRMLPRAKAQIRVDISGVVYEAGWDPRTSGDRERSGVIRVGSKLRDTGMSPSGPRNIFLTDGIYRIS